MGNMSYCRFENTLADLRDCAVALSESSDPLEELSDSERKCALALLIECRDLAADFEWTIQEYEEKRSQDRASRLSEARANIAARDDTP